MLNCNGIIYLLCSKLFTYYVDIDSVRCAYVRIILLKENNFDRSKKVLGEYCKEYPNDNWFHEKLSAVYSLEKNWSKAHDTLEKVKKVRMISFIRAVYKFGYKGEFWSYSAYDALRAFRNDMNPDNVYYGLKKGVDKIIDGLITNFHLPQSTLLLLVASLIGRERLLGLYEQAIENNYRFYSYGDSMLIKV